ncbi:hypothetical protein COLO4_24415 [Corchorus olitorius]|uniref:Uncharacterized protein n=1 Tax=Corchorus olitorius TaxID=93759 RepID=A0A1R3IA78_9ROSI|nr:hypothetical protein COLO4_24415 [Corchorus olitorius]
MGGEESVKCIREKDGNRGSREKGKMDSITKLAATVWNLLSLRPIVPSLSVIVPIH